MDWLFELILVVGLVFFTMWMSRLSFKLSEGLDSLEGSEDRLDEIRESIEIVAQILNKLPELMPQFNMNTNPLQPIFEAFARKLSGEQPLMTYEAPAQGADGRFNGTKEEENNTP
jgi:NADH:ubiquinone oxidoreductase subunit D